MENQRIYNIVKKVNYSLITENYRDTNKLVILKYVFHSNFSKIVLNYCDEELHKNNFIKLFAVQFDSCTVDTSSLRH